MATGYHLWGVLLTIFFFGGGGGGGGGCEAQLDISTGEGGLHRIFFFGGGGGLSSPNLDYVADQHMSFSGNLFQTWFVESIPISRLSEQNG